MSKTSNLPRAGAVERILRKDKVIVLGCVVLLVLGAGWYTIAGIGMTMSAVEMTGMAGPIGAPMQMGDPPSWSLFHCVMIFFMWWVMMIAMMTPSAAPTVLLFSAIKRVGPEKDRTALFSLCFLFGYLIAWAAFSLAATGAQWGFEKIGLSDGPMMTIRSRIFAGLVLIAAGAYQLSGFKNACLRHCQSPAQFLADHNRPGWSGALRTGALHGSYCLGCCWALMLLLFVGGIMNLYWIVAVAGYVAIEKLMPRAQWLVPTSGAALIGAGVWVIATLF
ncbi:DUF2182 domain-containing protein [Rhodobacteraceae bacterium B1Z28]|uniref:DUF2182 domain-containing protein n=1 Tax=Ruegeria haliotis TaxID=2747601 RepID=A0ABX2PL95_9RHOB|nr:DUF2182 domain-containing protein [Ruegeria haliotis]NVO54479.1 DUF2182 domain-containing protein [Ruegeria haliotis]